MISFTILIALIFVGACYRVKITLWTEVKEDWAIIAAISGLNLFYMLGFFCFKYLP